MNAMKVAKRQDMEGDGDEHQKTSSASTEPTGGKIERAETSSRRASRFHVDDKHILFGRGKGVSVHPGNKRMQRIIKKYRAQYHSSERGEKSLLVRKVYDELISGGTKFLKPIEGQEDGWEEVSVKVAVDKVGHSIRCAMYRPSSRSETHSGNSGSNAQSATSVSKSSTTVSQALPPPLLGSSQVRQEHTVRPQYLVGVSTTPMTGRLTMPFPRERIGIPSLLPSSLSSLDAYLAEVERNRLRSVLSLTPGSFSPSGTLNRVAPASQLFAMMDQQQQIRSLLGYHHPSSQTADLLSKYSVQK